MLIEDGKAAWQREKGAERKVRREKLGGIIHTTKFFAPACT
jgi:hypothetical protein